MEILIIIISLVIIAILVYGHTRLINITKNTVYNENKYIQKLYKKINQLNIETEMLITIFEFLISGMAVELFLELFEESLIKASYFNFTFVTIKALSILIITILATYFTMIVGRYIPKHIVHMRKKHKFNDNIIMHVYGFFVYVFYPITILSVCLDNVVREKVDNSNNDIEEVKEFTTRGLEKGSISLVEKEIIERTTSSLDQSIYKICIKMEDVISVKVNDNISNIMMKMAKNSISRVLVYDKNNLLGYIHIKDILINEQKLKEEKINITSIIKKPTKLVSEEPIHNCLKKMKNEKAKFAIVVDSYDDVLGIVTVGDIIDEIVGKLKEE